ncbi:Uncharacterised protein [Klebsiella pneumoniae]|nr:Uncharacterised protein [Klebsiella pneumoniae]
MRLGIKFFDLLNGFFQNRLDPLPTFIFIGTVFGDLEHAGFRQIEQILTGTPLRIVTGIGDLIGDRNHIADHRTFTDDISISINVRRTWRIFRKFCQIGKTTDIFQLAAGFQRFRQGDQVNRSSLLEQALHLTENRPVRAAEKVLAGHTFRDIIPTLVVQHQSAENGLFGFQGMWR